MLAAAPPAPAGPSPLAARGYELLESERCVTCHSFDGSLRDGPTFLGLAGSSRTVITGGQPRTVVADAAYLARSIREPSADVVDGFKTPMPRQIVTDDELAAMVAAIVELPATAPPASPARRALLILFWSVAAFVLLNFLLATGAARSALRSAYLPLRTMVFVATFAWMLLSYAQTPFVSVWMPPTVLRWLAIAVMPFAFLLLVAGLTTRATHRHALWGLGLWSVLHLLSAGDAAPLILFAGLTLLCALFLLQRPATPTPSLRTLGLPRIALALTLFWALFLSHELLIGLPALP